jgi:hypothetical protein
MLWLIGLPGILALTGVLVQSPRPDDPLAPPWWVIALASSLQSVLLLMAAVFAGTRLAPRIGLQAPLLSAVLAREPALRLMQSRLWPAIAGAAVGASILLLHASLLPPALREWQQQNALPLIVRVLYGGFTEEILVRWGLMTSLAWLVWRTGKGEDGVLAPWMAWTAIAISAIVFGIAHLPAARALLGEPGMQLTGLIVASNTAFGIMAGYLFWRYGLEAAIFAHVFAHIGFAIWSELWP